ncbi:MAG: hypothetical protein K2Y10_03935 [Burkholderiaceae bacterium]|nr:hypothetical protein [Burkholderiaceae bacterium]
MGSPVAIYGSNPVVSSVLVVSSSGGTACADTELVLMTAGEIKSLSVFQSSPEHYAAVGAVFSAILVAASAIWAVKRIIYIFQKPSEA